MNFVWIGIVRSESR